ncbi:MAG TPA: uracil-DNA glycosylase [Bdellovibrionota bacterium]|nr:uracil-DNA glycosylase [Bdellovibrionota bacterium]
MSRDASSEPQKELFELVAATRVALEDAIRRGQRTDSIAAEPAVPSVLTSVAPAEGVQSLPEIRAFIGECTRCKLHRGRKKLVFGVGNPNAELVFVGEAPGRDEDIQGEPFVGRAGQLLNDIIEAIGFKRNEVYICNVVKCRPPENRNPEPDEIETCEPFLVAQLAAIRPKIICALGKFAAQTLLKMESPISQLRGKLFNYHGVSLMPTYHPAFLLRNPAAKKDVWEDMKLLHAELCRLTGRNIPRKGK